ncbi:uncharacterized protein LOC111466326 [Cucurbita maxima]|uniref:Uncharacterized protein LOC111466326 n=1 Tax=Cucurbita maxima TaxID=3661 RepID=A0A6J1HSC0_CUCMA|nr:uncharacterized protein LOC111466326 [Cucurbita maxima]
MTIVSQMRTYEEKISNETIVAKVLRSLTPKFDHVVAAIEEAKDLSILSVDELMGSLQAHETRINRASERNEEKVEVIEEEDFAASMVIVITGVDGEVMDRDNSINKGMSYNVTIAETDNEEEEEEKLLMACMDTNPKKDDLWFVDSGCSNYMTGTKSLFKEFDETQKIKVQLGNTKEMQVEGKCTVKVEISHGIYNPISEKILVRRDVIFNENVSWDWSKEQEQQKITVEVSPNEETRVNSSASPSASTATQSVSNSSSLASLNSNSSLEELSDETPPRKYKCLADIYASCQFALTLSDPMNYEEATEKEDGKKGMAVEMQSVKKDGTWDMVDLPNKKFYGDLQEEVYVTPPEGFIKKDKETKVYKLRQTLYGLKQTYLRRSCQKKSSVLDICNFKSKGSVEI